MEDPGRLRFGDATHKEGQKCWLAARLAGCWRLFSNPRRRITNILCALAGASDEHIDVLGAGVCAGIDLHRLSAAYGHDEFVVADGGAMDCGLLLQPDVDFETIRSHRGVDLAPVEQRWPRNLGSTGAVSGEMW